VSHICPPVVGEQTTASRRGTRAGNQTGMRIGTYERQRGRASPDGKAMFQMLGVFAEFERSIIQERVRAGLARAGD